MIPKWARDDWLRFWLHFPVGMLGAWFISEKPILGVMFTAYFMFYEAMNDWRKVDHSYKDVIGAVFGFGVSAFILSIWRYYA